MSKANDHHLPNDSKHTVEQHVQTSEKPNWSSPSSPKTELRPVHNRERSLPLLPGRRNVSSSDTQRSSAPPQTSMEDSELHHSESQHGEVQMANQPYEDNAEQSHDSGRMSEQADGIEVNDHIIDAEMNVQYDVGGTDAQTNGESQRDYLPLSEQQAAIREEKPIDPKEILEPFLWDDLEDRFLRKMEECQHREEEIEKEFAEWCLVFKAWASTTREYEEERAHKRLRTRMAWVNNSEHSLEEKRQHYIKVVQAFESALALLAGP